MGERGTEAAKQVANVVLRDDDFTTIEHAVAEGRRIYDNILKFGQFLFTWNLSEVLLVAAAIAFGLPLPLVALQVLFLNIVVDLPPAYALAQEPADPDVMERPPRDPRVPLLTPAYAGLIVGDALTMTAAALSIYAWALGAHGPRAGADRRVPGHRDRAGSPDLRLPGAALVAVRPPATTQPPAVVHDDGHGGRGHTIGVRPRSVRRPRGHTSPHRGLGRPGDCDDRHDPGARAVPLAIATEPLTRNGRHGRGTAGPTPDSSQ